MLPQPPIGLLIVDDHAVVAQALADVLGRAPDLEVVGRTASIAETLEVLTRAPCPDVILLNVRLPDGDGADAIRELRTRCPDTAVLVLTATEGIDVQARAVSAGAAGLLTKGEQLSTLVDAIRDVHAGRVLFDTDTLSRVAAHLATSGSGRGQLTARELEVLRLLAEGATTERISRTLVISSHTVRSHVRNLLAKLGARSKLEGVAIALRQGLVEVEADR